MSPAPAGRTGHWLSNRSAAWQERRRAKLRALARRRPKLADDARQIGELRRAMEPYRGREMYVAAELRSLGFSLHEIGHTLYMPEQHVSVLLRRWKARTS